MATSGSTRGWGARLPRRDAPVKQPDAYLPLFTHLGVADSAMNAKPALASWDSVFTRPYRP